jgi:protocatechuate 3,4-dioxygenase beta subunit
VAADAVLVPGPGNGLGPSPARGDALVIAGAVLDASCEPVAGAEIDVWHTDARGAYGPAEGQCCYYQGTVGTDRNGRFRLDTVRPGQYAQTAAPPAHIHLEVRHPAGELRTEIVFVGDAGVPTAPVDGYAPVRLQRRDAGPPAWYGEVTLVVGGRTAGA